MAFSKAQRVERFSGSMGPVWPVDQLIWNHSYAGHDYLTGPSYVPLLGTSVEVVQSILALHTIWSICVPIALVETLSLSGLWLRTRGLAGFGLLFLAGSVFVFFGNYYEERFLVAVRVRVPGHRRAGGAGVPGAAASAAARRRAVRVGGAC